MERTTQRELKSMVALGMAHPPNNYDEIPASELDTIRMSFGKYGMNGALLQHRETGEFYAITSRSSTLFYYV